MSKVFVASVAVVLLVGSGAFGGILQNQGWDIGMANGIDVFGYGQANQALQGVTLNERQTVGVAAGDARQTVRGLAGQVSNAWGCSSQVGVRQTLDLGGFQGQRLGNGPMPNSQVEGLNLTAGQALGKVGGAGGADALQVFAAKQGQEGSDCVGTLNQSSSVMGMQGSNILSHFGGTVTTLNVMEVSVGQSQTVR